MFLQVIIRGPLPKHLEGLTAEEIKARLIADGACDPAMLQTVELIEGE